MIRIETKVKAEEACDIIRWALQFARNSCSDFEPTDEQLNQAAKYCVEGQDAWEAAAAIAEGWKLRRPRR